MTAIVDQVIAEHGWFTTPTPGDRAWRCACGHELERAIDQSAREAHGQHQMEAVEQAVREQIAAKIGFGLAQSGPSAEDRPLLDMYLAGWQHAMRLAEQIARGES